MTQQQHPWVFKQRHTWVIVSHVEYDFVHANAAVKSVKKKKSDRHNMRQRFTCKNSLKLANRELFFYIRKKGNIFIVLVTDEFMCVCALIVIDIKMWYHWLLDTIWMSHSSLGNIYIYIHIWPFSDKNQLVNQPNHNWLINLKMYICS